MTTRLKLIVLSREEIIMGIGLKVHKNHCLPRMQHHDLVLDCLGTKVSSSNSLKGWSCQVLTGFFKNEYYLVSTPLETR